MRGVGPAFESYVDYRSSLSFIGTILTRLALAPATVLLVALLHGGPSLPSSSPHWSWSSSAGLERLREDRELGRREALLMVSLTWLAVPSSGLSRTSSPAREPSPTPSTPSSRHGGFTTTGSTVMGQISVDYHSHSILLWRQLTQWIGGMGIIVLMVAILSELSVGGAQVMNEEARPASASTSSRPGYRRLRGRCGASTPGSQSLRRWYTTPSAQSVTRRTWTCTTPSHALTTMPTGGFSPRPGASRRSPRRSSGPSCRSCSSRGRTSRCSGTSSTASPGGSPGTKSSGRTSSPSPPSADS